MTSNNGLDDRCNVRVSVQTWYPTTGMNLHYTNMANLARYSMVMCVEEDPNLHKNRVFVNFAFTLVTLNRPTDKHRDVRTTAPTLFCSVLHTLERNINQYMYKLLYRAKSRVKTTPIMGV